MASDNSIFLMYHELERAGHPRCQSEEGYVRYVVLEQTFREQMSALQRAGLKGVNVSQALGGGPSGTIVVTFDDGCASDLLVAAPLLREFGFQATFYVVVGFLGRSGYMTKQQVRELADLDFEIGSHSMTHPYLDELNSSAVTRELGQSKTELEQIAGRTVAHFSCPGGRWSRDVARIARQCGYASVAGSRIGVNNQRSGTYDLRRIAVMRTTSLETFERLSRGRGLVLPRITTQLRQTARKTLGNRMYDALRRVLLGSGS